MYRCGLLGFFYSACQSYSQFQPFYTEHAKQRILFRSSYSSRAFHSRTLINQNRATRCAEGDSPRFPCLFATVKNMLRYSARCSNRSARHLIVCFSVARRNCCCSDNQNPFRSPTSISHLVVITAIQVLFLDIQRNFLEGLSIKGSLPSI